MRVQLVIIRLSAAPRALNNFHNVSWGSASLHPRLYAIASLRGLRQTTKVELNQSFLQFVAVWPQAI